MNVELYNQLIGAACIMMYKKSCLDKVAKYKSEMESNRMLLGTSKKIKDEWEAKRKAGVKTGSIIAFLCFLIVVPCLFAWGETLGGLVFFGAVLFISALVAIINAIIMVNKLPKMQKEYNTKCETCKKENKELLAKSSEIIDQLDNMWASCPELYDFLPEKYQELYAVLFMLDAVKSLRVDTLKEAINLWEAELKWMAEQQQKRQFEAIRQRQNAQMMAALSEIESNQEQLNSNLRDIKVMQYIDYYNKQ